eukprot:TRINITY_DN1301_c0_g1_i1.p2 TRINITY_DN1301_c0_g1~~TRINITY_DN1301_c0_g1_i1.p2  ORF type:complete len:391 (-),score=52.87 TRINITY_DN1301_c0_g1_i1:503-1609(-)
MFCQQSHCHGFKKFANKTNNRSTLIIFQRQTISKKFVPISCDAVSVDKLQNQQQLQNANLDAVDEVSIRRRPPQGINQQPCGPVQFKVDVGDDNKPQNILEEIVWHKNYEIERLRMLRPISTLMAVIKNAPSVRDFKGAILQKMKYTNRPGLVAEVKKASPSRGVIQPNFDPVEIAKGYEAGGAACLSVLTDEKYFQGSFNNLKEIRKAGVQCPLLCKEFIVDGYQLFLARASGADAILLIAAVLPNKDLQYFTKAAHSLGMQCLIEVHTVGELRRVLEIEGLENHMLGINNRDLQTFKVDLNNTKSIMESEAGLEVQRRGLVMIGESGIFTPEHVAFVQECGCKGILVGESIVKEGDQESAVKQLLA